MHLKTNGFMIKDNNDNAMGDGDDSSCSGCSSLVITFTSGTGRITKGKGTGGGKNRIDHFTSRI